MLFYTVIENKLLKNRDSIKIIPPERVWADYPESIDAFSGWLQDFVVFGEMVHQGTASICQFIGPKPIPLPLNLSLNYIDVVNAATLSDEDYKNAVKWLSQFDSQTLINSQYEPGGLATKVQDVFGPDNKRSRVTGRELVKVLSDVVKTIGPLVWNPQDSHPEMKYQIIATQPFELTVINDASIISSGYISSLFLSKDPIVRRINNEDIKRIARDFID